MSETTVIVSQDQAGVIARLHNGVQIPQRVCDRYVNVTKMCQANGKRWSHYLARKGTAAFLEALSIEAGIPASMLIQVKKGGVTEVGGKGGADSWAHPDVAIDCAQWISPMFRVQVNRWINELLTAGEVSIKPAESAAPRPWSERITKSFEAHRQFINGRWPSAFSVLTATAIDFCQLEDVLIQHLLPVKRSDLPDNSVASRWRDHRKAEGLAEPGRRAPLYLPDRERTVQVKVYDGDELKAFYLWYMGTYLPQYSPEYLRRKFKPYGYLVAESAADNLCRRVLGGDGRANLPAAHLAAIDRSEGKMVKAVNRLLLPPQRELFPAEAN